MGIFNRAIPNIQRNNLNQVVVTKPEEYYVDDIFDPLFNAAVRNQLRAKYGNDFLAVLGGYAEGVDNALLGQDDKWGILGSGMGILSGFGRSMDKAGDVIIGSLTEGVKGVTGQGVENPLENIFVKDQDYTGNRLLAAMGNSMAGIAKAPKLTEKDFTGLWNIPGVGLELATDPSILGGNMIKASKPLNLAQQVSGQTASTKLADIGKLMMDYDDLMSKISIDLTAPGLRYTATSLKNKIGQKLAHSSAKHMADTVLNSNEAPEARQQAQQFMRSDPEVKYMLEMREEVSKAEELIKNSEAAATSSTTSTPLTNLQNYVPKPNEAYEHSMFTQLVSQKDLDESVANTILKAYKTDLPTLIKSEQMSAEELDTLEKAIAASNDADLITANTQFEKFLTEGQSKGLITNTDLNLHPVSSEDFSTIDPIEIHNLAKQYYSGVDIEVSPEYLNEIVPIELSQKTYGEAPELYQSFIDNIVYGNTSNESARNTVLKDLGFDPKSKKRLSLNQSPITVSPSWYQGRSDTTLKQQVLYANKLLTNFVNKYPIETLIDDVNFKSAFPNSDDRKEIVALIQELTSPAEDTTALNYLEKTKDFTELFSKINSESINTTPGLDDVFNLAYGDLSSEAFDEALNSTFSFDTLKRNLIDATEYRYVTDEEFDTISQAVEALKAQGFSYSKIKKHIGDTYEQAHASKTTKLYRAISRSKLTPENLEVYDRVINDYKTLQRTLNAWNNKRLGITKNTLLNELRDSAEKLNKNVINTFDRKIDAPIIEYETLPFIEEHGVDGENFTTHSLKKELDSKQKSRFREKTSNDLYSIGTTSSVNTLIRLNSKTLSTQEGLDLIKKYFGNTYQIKVHPEYGKIEGVATKAIEAFKKNILPDIEVLVENDYSPFSFIRKETIAKMLANGKLKEDTPGYRVAAECGLIPDVNASEYAPQYREIIKTIVKDFEFANTTKNTEMLGRAKRLTPTYLDNVYSLAQSLYTNNPIKYSSFKEFDKYRQYLNSKSYPKDDTAARRLFEALFQENPPPTIVDAGIYFPFYQYYRRLSKLPAGKRTLKQFGWIDYSYLYGNRNPVKLYDRVVNTELSAWRDPLSFKEARSPRGALYNLIDETLFVKKSADAASDLTDKMVANLTAAPDKEAAEIVAEFPTAQEAVAEQIPEIMQMSGEAVSRKTADTSANKIISEPRKLSDLTYDAVQAQAQAVSGTKHTTRSAFVQNIFEKASKLMENLTIDDVAKYKRAQIYLNGAYVKKEEFLDHLASSGTFLMAFKKDETFDKIYQDLQHNIANLNIAVGANVLVPIKYSLPNGSTVIGAMWDASNKKILNIIDKNIKKVDTSKLKDIVRLSKGELTDSVREYLSSDKYRQINDVFEMIREEEQTLSKLLGFTYDNLHHVKNVRRADADVANYLANILYKGLPIDKLDDISDKMVNLPAFKHLRGSWGTRKYETRFIGYIEDFEDEGIRLFEDDIAAIAKGSLGEGSFNNSKFQTFVELFRSPNFKISQFASKPEDLERVLYATLEDGSESGNLQNLVLAAPRYDKTGRVIGFTQFDKTTRIGLQNALKNSETVLLPSNVFAPLDKILRKDAQMSNRVYSFINRHFTLPFKMGVLMNPGFLLGNANDAYLKQATTMANKYGTSVPEELANVALAIRDVVALNNRFDASYRKFLTHIQAEGFPIAPSNNISELAATDPRIRKMLKEYISDSLKKSNTSPSLPCMLSKNEKNTVRLWLMLNSVSTGASFDRGFQDLDILAKAANKSEYQMPQDIVERILSGQGKYDSSDVSTWGLFINNPLAQKIMSTSESIENLFRASSMLNDLRHNGIDESYINKYFDNLDELKSTVNKNSEGSAEATAKRARFKKDFNFKMTEAINTMHNANFDYEKMSDFTDNVGKIMPFPTFFLKNLAYWLEIFVEHPQYIDHAITVQENMWRDKDITEDEFLASAKGRGAVPLPESGQNLSKIFKGIYKPTPLQSMFGAFSLINNPISDVYYRLHPALSSGITAASELPPIKPIAAKVLPEKEVKYRPYSTNRFEKNITRDDPNFNPLAYAVHRANPLERTTQSLLRLPDKLKHDDAQLSDFLPSVFQPDFSKK